MSNYNPNVPASGSENISSAEPDIRNNFQKLNTIFNNDHYTWNDATLAGANRGYHRKISFPAAISDPAIGSFSGILYPKNDIYDTSTEPQVFFENPNGLNAIQQLTNRFHKTDGTDIAPNGYFMLPLGTPNNRSLIFMWGRQDTFAATSGGKGVQPITLPSIDHYNYQGGQTKGFPNSIFNVQVTMARNDADTTKNLSVKTGSDSPTKEGFSIVYSSTDMNRVYWFAIGT